jgi:hypothetical protein
MKSALVEMEVCKLDVALTKQEADNWVKENEISWYPDKISVPTEYLYCYAVRVQDLALCSKDGIQGAPKGFGIEVGSWVINLEAPCPACGCIDRYQKAQGKVIAIFEDEDGAEMAYADKTKPQTEFWFTNIYQ